MADPTQDLLKKGSTDIAARAGVVKPWDFVGRGMGIHGPRLLCAAVLVEVCGQKTESFCSKLKFSLDLLPTLVEQDENIYCG